ncbi:hypothetical protein Taro_054844 [Colocasia esculenta]|uniref:Uncharacterized protein n=1 Tax=Colocasia esculenta TaxID=4460 RepID=A0A843XPY7_COLES|nr:hypothetical protein [Colocasia esculenta]
MIRRDPKIRETLRLVGSYRSLGCNGFLKVQPARRLRMCAKAKKTYGGLDKESLAQSRVFPMERWFKSRESSIATGVPIAVQVATGRPGATGEPAGLARFGGWERDDLGRHVLNATCL